MGDRDQPNSDDLVAPDPPPSDRYGLPTPASRREWAWPSDEEIPLVVPVPPPIAPLRTRLRPHRIPANPYASLPDAPRPRRPARRLVAALSCVIVALILAAGGYLLGHEDRSDAPAQAAAQERSRAGIALRYPAEWTSASKGPDIPNLRFEQPLVLSSGGPQDAGIVAGIVPDAVGSDLLPAALRKRLSDASPEPVLLGDVQALRYARVEVEGYEQQVTLFAVPTATGSVMIACHDPGASQAFAAICRQTAATLRLEGKRALAIGPDAGYGRRLGAAIKDLGAALKRDGTRLRKARTARTQARAADGVEATFSRVAHRMRAQTVSARDRDAHDDLVTAIGAVGRAYRRLGSAARAGSRSRYATARGAVRRTDARLRETIAALRTLGYGR